MTIHPTMPLVERQSLSTIRMVALSAFWFGSAVWLYVFVLLLVPLEVEAVVGGSDPNVAEADQQSLRAQAKGAALGVTLLCGALVATLAAPLVGSISDHCDSRQRSACGLGRRAPWLIAGVSLACIASVCLYFSTSSYWLYTASFAALQLSIGIGASPFTGLLSDAVIPGERGAMSGIVGACLALGNLYGALIGALRPLIGRAGLYFLCMATVVLSTLITVLAVRSLIVDGKSSGNSGLSVRSFPSSLPGSKSQGQRGRRKQGQGQEREQAETSMSGGDMETGSRPLIGTSFTSWSHSGGKAGADVTTRPDEPTGLGQIHLAFDPSSTTSRQAGQTSPPMIGHDSDDEAALLALSGDSMLKGSDRLHRVSLPNKEGNDSLNVSDVSVDPVRQRPRQVAEHRPAGSEDLYNLSSDFPRPTKAALVDTTRSSNSIPIAETGFFSAFDDPDFFWAFWSRVSIQMGVFTVQEYLLLYIQYAVKLPSGLAPSQALSAAMVPLFLAALVAPLLVGSLSDKAGGQRRAMLYLAGGTMVAVAIGMAFCRTWSLLLPLAGLFGLGYGAFSALDLALALDVLPSAESDSARDLGLWNLALAAPLCVAAPVAGVLLDWGNQQFGSGNGFSLLFAMAGVYFAVGVAFLTRISARVN